MRTPDRSRWSRTASAIPLALLLGMGPGWTGAAPASAQTAREDTGAVVRDAVATPARVAGADAGSLPLPAVRLRGTPPLIDGRIDDPAWSYAPVAVDFVQYEPVEGVPASEASEVRVLYDDDALYVAFRAFDGDPDAIAAQLTRRDEPSHSDRVHVIVDSYHDRRTAFHFAVNPLGVKSDYYRYDDTREDAGWNAVWEVATAIDEEGWTAEFRIPLSQLRFSGAPVQSWGINFIRDIARRNETSTWAPVSRQEQALVSRSGTLAGLRDLPTRRRIEVLPYTVARATRGPGDPANPFYRSTHLLGEAGADVKVGVTNNLTLDLTVNPDFGQVEADPGQVNLTAFETFLPERRPFFAEGAGIFRFVLGLGDGDGENESLFYSRRIGRSPQGGASANGGWVDRPGQTRILTAGKLSGKTDSGWSIGALGALTGQEEARIAHPDGDRALTLIEPRTTYTMARLQKDFREGASAVGAVGTATVRDADAAKALDLRDRAYTGGLDFRHRFRANTYELRGYLMGSHVTGSPAAIAATQRSPTRYFQRPDADHVTFDPDATSLSGWSGTMELWKIAGGPWAWASLTQFRSPGFEVNDMGFLNESDQISQVFWAGYRRTTPGAHLRNWRVNANTWSGWTFGGEHGSLGGNVNGGVTFNNNWGANAGLNMNRGRPHTRLLRGGPSIRTENNYNGWMGIGSDGRRDLQMNLNANGAIRPEADSWSANVSPNVRWRPSGRATLRVGPFLSYREEDRQWVGRIQSADGPHYVFGRLEQTTFGLTTRVDLAVTPDLTLQLYAQPFTAAGSYGEFKQVADPRAQRYEQRFAPLDVEAADGAYLADLNGDGVQQAFANPDFNFGQFRSNAVLRWEYRPGSTLFVVWSQSRDHATDVGDFRFGDGMEDLFGQRPENTLMLKLSYWLNP